jgi:hypothetical protein
MQMRDEVREVHPSLYLGLGAFGLRDARRVQPLPFLLRGPFNQLSPQQAEAAGLQGADAVLARAPASYQGDLQQQQQQQEVAKDEYGW